MNPNIKLWFDDINIAIHSQKGEKLKLLLVS